MKKINTLLAMVIALIFITGVSSCNKEMELFVDIDEQKFCLPAYGTQLQNGHLFTFEYELAKVRSEFDKQGLTYAENRINDIKVSAFTIEFESGFSSSLKELSGAQVYVKKVGEIDLGKQVAYVDIPESDVAAVNFNINGESLKPYLSEDKIVFSVTVFNRYGTGNKEGCFHLKGGKISIEAKK